MCGIAGATGPGQEARVRAMTATLAHRGPDDAGFYADDGVALGHRRLSIIDLAAGHQPMTDASGTVWIVFNGEIYNYRELRAELEAKHYDFRTNSDTETILNAYLAYGDACVSRLQGMFAFALWDTRSRTLLLARDPLGIKPLYYAERGGVLYFGSEMKAILAVPEFPRALDYEALDDYLAFLYTVPPRTMFRDIRQLPPGHSAIWRAGGLTVRRYWQLDCTPEDYTEHEWVERVNAHLDETVRKHLMAEVPLGALLSGGLDSTAIVSHMVQAADGPIDTFTVGFGDAGRRYDETAEARELAAWFQTRHHEIRVEADAAQQLDTLLHHFDEPFGNPTALLSYELYGWVRKHVTVALSGDGGDECFGGYQRYAGLRFAESYRRLPHALRRYGVLPLTRLLPESTRGFHALRRLRRFAEGTLLPPVDMYARWVSYCTPEERAALYAPGTLRQLQDRDPLDFIRGLARDYNGVDPVQQAMYIDLHSFLPNNVLHYGDRMSMAHGLETRVPFADHRLVELTARMPSAFKVQGRQTKTLLRQCLRGRLPESTLSRTKTGFNPPMGVWLNTQLQPLLHEHLSEASIRARGLFEPKPITRMIEAHRAGRRDYTWHLWPLLLLEAWCRHFLD